MKTTVLERSSQWVVYGYFVALVRDRHTCIGSMILFVASLTSVHSTVLQPPKEGTTMVPDSLVCSVDHQRTRMAVLCLSLIDRKTIPHHVDGPSNVVL